MVNKSWTTFFMIWWYSGLFWLFSYAMSLFIIYFYLDMMATGGVILCSFEALCPLLTQRHWKITLIIFHGVSPQRRKQWQWFSGTHRCCSRRDIDTPQWPATWDQHALTLPYRQDKHTQIYRGFIYWMDELFRALLMREKKEGWGRMFLFHLLFPDIFLYQKGFKHCWIPDKKRTSHFFHINIDVNCAMAEFCWNYKFTGHYPHLSAVTLILNPPSLLCVPCE